jgi:uncharacterized protein (DUF488 family)
MSIPTSVKSYWESRIPELTGGWTHWRLIGDGKPIALFAGDRLSEALRFVEVNYLCFSSIKCQLATADESGKCSEVDELVVEIANLQKQQLMHNES